MSYLQKSFSLNPTILHASVLGEWVRQKFKKIFHRKNNNTKLREKRLPDQETRVYAQMSEASYNPDRKEKIGPFNYEPEWSNPHQAVYANDREVVIAYRGTKEIEDFGVDGYLAMNQLGKTDRARATQAMFENMQEANYFAGRNVTVTGHSLGGTLARHVGDTYRDSVHRVELFNPGHTVRVRGPFERAPEKDDRVTEHFIAGDPISGYAHMTTTNKTKFYDQRDLGMDFHTIRNFT